ncbi:MAG: 3-phosphoshikimate 1-carboxyvinyltransferase [Gemmatimonadota bacterium]|nr:MAG: 3-phosphoshikimate 1-carboxyvinyltransferase [Gemmatimonadota bacterium]
MLAPLADGTSHIRGLALSEDVRATGAAMGALGAPAIGSLEEGQPIEIRGPVELRSPGSVIDCGNSGTTARLMVGLLAGSSAAATLDGDESLRRRPMDRVVQPLRRAGASVRELREPGYLPLEIEGCVLSPIRHESEAASAQVKSALLLAGLVSRVPVRVIEPGASRDHTERMLRAMGAQIEGEPQGKGMRVSLEPLSGALKPINMAVPGDFSSAAFWLGLAVLGGCRGEVRIEGVGLNPGRTGFLRVLDAMGASLDAMPSSDEAGEPVGDVVVRPSAMRGVEIPPEWVPALIDEIPIIACVASRAVGRTIIRGAQELRVKESDRIAALHANLVALGVSSRERPDGLEIEGADRAVAGVVETRGDHRIAMAFGVLGAVPGNSIAVDDRACARVSYPGFWEELDRVTASGPEP